MDSETIALLEKAERDAWTDMYAAVPDDLRAALGFRVEQQGSAAGLVLPRVDYSDFNRVIGLGVEEPATEELVDRFLEVYKQCGVRRFLLHVTPNAQPPELREWLTARGLVATRRWAKVFLREATPRVILTGLEIEEVSEADRMIFGRTVCAGFGMPEMLTPWSAALVGRKGWRAFIAKDGDEAVAAGALYVKDGIAWLGVGATRPSHRRRGAQGALMARRLAEGFASGCRLAVSEGAEELTEKPNSSFHNMMRNGFQVAYLRENYGLPTEG